MNNMAPEEKIVLAYELALKHHGSQMYGDMPYIYHLNQVALSVAGYGHLHVAVAYLHDILEDTTCTEGELRKHFLDEVVDAVVAITKVDGEKYFAYLTKVAANKIAHKVKMCDTLCNLTESVKGQQWRRVEKYAEQLRLLSTLT